MSLYSLKLTIFQYEHCVYFLVTLLSESIAKPDRYAPRPAIICPFSRYPHLCVRFFVAGISPH